MHFCVSGFVIQGLESLSFKLLIAGDRQDLRTMGKNVVGCMNRLTGTRIEEAGGL